MKSKESSMPPKVFSLSLPENDHRRVRSLGRSRKASSAAVVRASVELALDEWESRGLPAKNVFNDAK